MLLYSMCASTQYIIININKLALLMLQTHRVKRWVPYFSAIMPIRYCGVSFHGYFSITLPQMLKNGHWPQITWTVKLWGVSRKIRWHILQPNESWAFYLKHTHSTPNNEITIIWINLSNCKMITQPISRNSGKFSQEC